MFRVRRRGSRPASRTKCARRSACCAARRNSCSRRSRRRGGEAPSSYTSCLRRSAASRRGWWRTCSRSCGPREPALELRHLSEPVVRAVDVAATQARGQGNRHQEDRRRGASRSRSATEEQMYQVALNLLVNAIEVLPAGGNRHGGDRRSRRRFSPASRCATTGREYPRRIARRIFQPFFTQREGGTGSV